MYLKEKALILVDVIQGLDVRVSCFYYKVLVATEDMGKISWSSIFKTINLILKFFARKILLVSATIHFGVSQEVISSISTIRWINNWVRTIRKSLSGFISGKRQKTV